MNNLIFCVISVAVIVKTATSQSGPGLKTPLGSIQGRRVRSFEGRTVTAFEGIPYAKPPVGDLRFKEPQPAGKWSGTLVADKTYVCTQYTLFAPISDVTGDEDCLYLYIYVPRETITGKENMDVVVHIHGGGFSVGDPKSHAGPDYIMDRDLVYVTMNYRLGILGFLSTEDDVVPGNNGLKDQVLAMKWIKDNIQYFGGNPNSITLTGYSAGGASVHYHYLSPLSIGLFNRGLSQGGTVLNMWGLTENPAKKAWKLDKVLDCKANSSKSLVDCLRTRPAREVTLAQRNFTVFANSVPPSPFGPVIEYWPGGFLPDHPYKLLLEGRINDLPWITSNTKDEGILPTAFFVGDNKLEELGNRWVELAPHVLDYDDTAHEFNKKAIATILRSQYFKDEPLSTKNVHDLVRLVTDRYYHIDGLKALCLHATVAAAPVYHFLFDYPIEMTVNYKANISGVSHQDDAKMLYRQIGDAATLSESDRRMKNIFIDFLYRYASTGKPDFKGVDWFPIHSSLEPINYLHILSPDDIRMEAGTNLEPFAFWHQLPLLENEHLFNYFLSALQYLPVFY